MDRKGENAMQLLDKIKQFADKIPGQAAVQNDSCRKSVLTYGELERFSDALAGYINRHAPQDGSPIVVYGHKNIYIPAVFIACAKAGHPYCPIESSDPVDRVRTIISQVNPHIIFATETLDVEHSQMVSLEEIENICLEDVQDVPTAFNKTNTEDVFLILFTSGSTGQPKGVELTADNIDTFFIWFEKKVATCQDGFVFLSQLSYTFDLGTMELYAPLWMGGTSFVIEKSVQSDFKQMIPALGRSNAVAAMFTPYLAEMCLLSKKFSENLMPRLRLMMLAGEVLEHSTAAALLERFPQTAIFNMYGPTEATIVITEQRITSESLEQYDTVPIGTARDGNTIEIWDGDDRSADNGTTGEIVIKGNAVARGYFGQQDMTDRVFIPYCEGGISKLAYRTGDSGYIDQYGTLHYKGRIDMQVQIHGYRVELTEIEKHMRRLEYVSNAVVLPKWDGSRVKYLAAFVVLDSRTQTANSEQQMLQTIRGDLQAVIPQYMIPQKIKFMDSFPQNKNGKVDRKKLGTLV